MQFNSTVQEKKKTKIVNIDHLIELSSPLIEDKKGFDQDNLLQKYNPKHPFQNGRFQLNRCESNRHHRELT